MLIRVTAYGRKTVVQPFELTDLALVSLLTAFSLFKYFIITVQKNQQYTYTDLYS